MHYEIAVVGGGAMGMATAYALLREGAGPVVVLERYSVGHDRAASTDRTKAIRYEYGDSEMYARMVGRAIELWRDLEAVSGQELYVNCGVASWGRGGDSYAKRSYLTVKRLGISIEELSPKEFCSRFPQFSPADMSYVTWNPEGGFLRASDCVSAFASQVVALGGEIRENSGVVGLGKGENRVELHLENGDTLTASRVVLTPGAWGASLLPQLGLRLPLTANKQQVVYMGGLGQEFAPGRFPVFLNLDHEFYGFPLDDNGLFKASIHLPGPVIDPNVPQVPDPAFVKEIRGLLARYIPGAAQGEVAQSRMCMYAMTPDEDFVIDHLPGYSNVVLGAGFSGHGFKFAPLIGSLLASLVLGGEPEFSLAPFSLARA